MAHRVHIRNLDSALVTPRKLMWHFYFIGYQITQEDITISRKRSGCHEYSMCTAFVTLPSDADVRLAIQMLNGRRLDQVCHRPVEVTRAVPRMNLLREEGLAPATVDPYLVQCAEPEVVATAAEARAPEEPFESEIKCQEGPEELEGQTATLEKPKSGSSETPRLQPIEGTSVEPESTKEFAAPVAGQERPWQRRLAAQAVAAAKKQ